MNEEAKYIITLSDNEKQIITESELQEAIESAYEFDGFLGFTYKKLKPGEPMPEHIFDEDRQPEEKPFKFDWHDDMAQISGFAGQQIQFGETTLYGDDYEEDCRRMVEAGVQWLWETFGYPPSDLGPTFKESLEYVVYEFYDGDGDGFKADLKNALADGSERGATSAMVAITFAHAMFIWHRGWDSYEQGMIDIQRKLSDLLISFLIHTNKE